MLLFISAQHQLNWPLQLVYGWSMHCWHLSLRCLLIEIANTSAENPEEQQLVGTALPAAACSCTRRGPSTASRSSQSCRPAAVCLASTSRRLCPACRPTSATQIRGRRRSVHGEFNEDTQTTSIIPLSLRASHSIQVFLLGLKDGLAPAKGSSTGNSPAFLLLPF